MDYRYKDMDVMSLTLIYINRYKSIYIKNPHQCILSDFDFFRLSSSIVGSMSKNTKKKI